ncbi:hypothetical protein EXN66_Car011903 [Channa argus]|uniref:Chemokine interleukin-8-like domain-containing protein n=1 Tax=Channa argus TaxID=215402 RepID=A0A6G1Q145_CHAAH|nr:hypothetical protein EXN66_Car011903 [Channa argus]KAK2902549.1 hypothetical protein Q8A73_012295 [Channa argus]
MKSVVFAFLTCLLVLCTQGQLAGRSNNCKCYSYVGRVNPRLIKTEPVVYHPNIFCQKTEIIITIANKEKCLNPQSPLGQLILKNHSRNTKKTAVSTMAASTQTNTRSSETQRLHTTVKLLQRR